MPLKRNLAELLFVYLHMDAIFEYGRALAAMKHALAEEKEQYGPTVEAVEEPSQLPAATELA